MPTSADPRARRGRLGRLVATLMVGVLSAAAAGCSEMDSGGAGSSGYFIGIDFPSQNQARWGFEAKIFQEQAKKNGDRTIVNFANYSTSKQTSDVETMLQQGVDVLILSPVDSIAAAALVTRAQGQGVKVITYDAGVSGATADYAVERNNYDAGKLHAESAMKAVPAGNYALIRGDKSTSVAQGMSKAYDDLLLKNPNVHVVFDQWTPGWDSAQAQKNAEAALLSSNNDIDAFIVSWDDGAQGVVQALKTAGLPAGRVYVTGTDATVPSLANIASGWQSETVWTPIGDAALAAANIGHALASGQNVPAPDDTVNGVKTKYLNLSSVDRANLCNFITKIALRGWASPQQVYGSETSSCA